MGAKTSFKQIFLKTRPRYPVNFNRSLNSLRVGDPARLNLLESVVETIEKDDLLKRTRDSGETLMSGLKELQNKYPDYVADPRWVQPLTYFTQNSMVLIIWLNQPTKKLSKNCLSLLTMRL